MRNYLMIHVSVCFDEYFTVSIPVTVPESVDY